MSSNIKLRCGNAKELIIDVPENSQDLILTDPPYDMITPNIKTPPLSAFTKEILSKNFHRILKPTGNILIFVGLRDKFRWDGILRQYHFALRAELIMVYPAGMKTPKHFQSAHESAMQYSLSKNYYFKEGALFADVYNTKRARGVTRNWGYDYATAPADKMHVTPKPLGMVQKLVEILCPEGGNVIDPFMGSGTTGEACVVTGRNFTGYELKKDIYLFARDRIKTAGGKRKENEVWW